MSSGKIKKIGIDCRMSEETGIGRYIKNLVIEISKVDSKNDYVLFMNQNSSLKNVSLGRNFKKKIVNIAWHGFKEQTVFMREIVEEKLDLYHSPQSNMPYFYPKKFLITVHDLTIIKHRTGRASTHVYWLYLFKRTVFKVFLYLAIYKSEYTITVSQFVRDDLVKIFPYLKHKIVCIYNGYNSSVIRKIPSEVDQGLRKFQLQEQPYFFYVGNASPHKNLETLISAFTLFNKDSKFKLVLAGKLDFFYRRLQSEYQDAKNVVFLGEVTDEELSVLYSGCSLFVYPSVSEGFGLQLLEAAHCGAKISCSGNTSFPEIVGDGAWYFDPGNIESMVESFRSAVTSDNKLTAEKLDKMLDKFSWKKSAKEHLELYEKA